jgi:hypothetical protein
MIYIGDVVADSVYQMCYDMYETITGGARTAYPNPYIEGQTTQFPKEKEQRNKQRSTKHHT